MTSDEEFDRWIVASDAVLLPYREIWSSGVLERARILDRRVIAAPAGGLVEQVRPDDMIVSDDVELANAIAELVGGGPPTEPEPMTVPEALAFVEDESGKRRAGSGSEGVDRALHVLDSARGVQPIVLPSQRPVIGRTLDLIKRVARRGLGWLLTPMLGQINEFERLTVETFEAMIAEQRGTAPWRYSTFDYDAFENEFRGDPELLKDKLRLYVDRFERGPVLDVGCGRGEFLELLREAGVEGMGVDLSLDLVTTARAKGLKVDHGDGIAYLRNLKPSTLSGIMAAQVVEHMSPRALIDFLAAARRALRGSGTIILETVNPESLYALANWYTMDLTHVQPVHPRTLSFLAKQAGFEQIEIVYLSHARAPHEPLDIPDDAPAWAKTMGKILDDEMSALNNTVFGAQDFALIARVR
jgi:SAM-dependent methyltransferase